VSGRRRTRRGAGTGLAAGCPGTSLPSAATTACSAAPGATRRARTMWPRPTSTTRRRGCGRGSFVKAAADWVTYMRTVGSIVPYPRMSPAASRGRSWAAARTLQCCWTGQALAAGTEAGMARCEGRLRGAASRAGGHQGVAEVAAQLHRLRWLALRLCQGLQCAPVPAPARGGRCGRAVAEACSG